MKIGILTYHCVPNFGAQLQATSTVGYLRRMGHEPVLLHWYPSDLQEMYSVRVPREQAMVQMDYAEKSLPVSALCRTTDELVKVIDTLNLDGVICGSDALFKFVPQKCRKYFLIKKRKFRKVNVLSVEDMKDNPFFGGFASLLQKKIPVVAFSVSSQNAAFKKMNSLERSTLKDAMDNFACISTRDEWTRQMVEFLTGRGRQVDITPDPVFAFNENCGSVVPSREEILAKYGIPENYVLFSFNTKYATADWVDPLAEAFRNRGLTPVAFPMPERLQTFNMETSVPLPLSPLDWYALIKYSRGYVGERMHPVVVCLHNAVPFFAFDEYGVVENRMWGLWTRFRVASSKTYHILNEAGFLKNWCSYLDGLPLPSAETVVDAVLSFDKAKCENFARKCFELYSRGMEKCIKEICC